MRGLQYTGNGKLSYHPPLDEIEDAKKFCPHCHGRLGKTTAPTILPPPWFDHQMREVTIGDERRKLNPTMFRLLVILWERPDRLLSHSILMILLYPNPDTAPLAKSLEINLSRLRKAILGTPYSIINRWGEGFIFTTKPPHAREIARRAKRELSGHI